VPIYMRMSRFAQGKGVADGDKLVVQLSDDFLCVLRVLSRGEERWRDF
jgi:hypothetical protein